MLRRLTFSRSVEEERKRVDVVVRRLCDVGISCVAAAVLHSRDDDARDEENNGDDILLTGRGPRRRSIDVVAMVWLLVYWCSNDQLSRYE